MKLGMRVAHAIPSLKTMAFYEWLIPYLCIVIMHPCRSLKWKNPGGFWKEKNVVIHYFVIK